MEASGNTSISFGNRSGKQEGAEEQVLVGRRKVREGGLLRAGGTCPSS